MTSPHRPRVLLADDHPVVCQGFRDMLAPTCDVVAMVHHGLDVVEAVERHRPDILLLDLGLPGKSGADVLRELQTLHPALPVMIVSMHSERVFAEESLRAGARGYAVKSVSGDELREAVRSVLAGKIWVSETLRDTRRHRSLAMREVEDYGVTPAMLAMLTDRQREVLRLIGQGFTTLGIAERMGLTEKGVEYHRSALKKELGLGTHAALVRYAALYVERAAGQEQEPPDPPGEPAG